MIKYKIKELFEEGCTERYIIKENKKFIYLSFYDNGTMYQPMEVIKKLINELNMQNRMIKKLKEGANNRWTTH